MNGLEQAYHALEIWRKAADTLTGWNGADKKLYCVDISTAYRAIAATADRIALHALKEAMRYQREGEDALKPPVQPSSGVAMDDLVLREKK